MKLVIVEDRFSAGNPATSSLVLALPHLLEAGCEVEVWADSIDEDLRGLCEFRRLPAVDVPHAPPVLSWFWRHLQGGLRKALRRDSGKGEVRYVSSGGRFLFADVSMFHFYNKAWWRIQRRGIEWGPESSLKGWPCLWGWLEDSACLRSPWTRTFLPVSDAIGDEMRRDFPDRAIHPLPNAIDARRYCPQLRREKRAGLRREFGFADKQRVLLFVSQGHLARKGFWLALKALDDLRRERRDGATAHTSGTKFVLLGGRPAKVERIKRYLDSAYPDWPEWVQLVGWTDRVHDYMAAADGLFFPSYFEAFSLVEIEAAAVGLPLILTRHHGSEMILEDGVNGLGCGFELEEIKATLRKFLAEGIDVRRPDTGRALTPQQWAQRFLAELN